MVRTSSGALLEVLNQIFDFSKIDAGQVGLETGPFDIREGLGDAIKIMTIRVKEKNLELIFRVADAIPRILVGDLGKLRQVIINLIGNAIKSTSSGRVLAQMTELSGDLHFEVKDTGVGILLEKQQKIFEPFIQANTSTTRHFGGTGLGLTIAKQWVERMHSRIWVESTFGVGSTFHFTVPLEALK